jgi:rare lipoprotein A
MRPFGFTQGRESLDVTRDHEPVEWLVERGQGFRQMKKLFFLYIISVLSLSSCARERAYVRVPPAEKKAETAIDSYLVNGERYYSLPDSMGFIETGKASWYGDAFHGRPTSSGETFDMHKKTAAHKTLPIGTYVKVINLESNRSTIVRINDRGPFVKGRIIDLSYGAAKEIDMDVSGTADVKIIALGKEIGELRSKDGSTPLLDIRDFETGEFTVQVGSFKKKNNAINLAERLKVIFDYVNIMEYTDTDDQIFFRLHVSKSSTLSRAGEMEKRLKDMGFTEAFILRI